MTEGWVQEFDGASYYYRPDFTDTETPFKDIRDFGNADDADKIRI
jgi:hypothetical protein